MQQHEGASILFVCRANVCRSAVAEFAASERLTNTGLRISSAGTDGVNGQKICERASDFVAERPNGREFAWHHRATRLTAAALARTALIVTATPRERSVVARLDPGARSRTFTMIELERLLSILPPTAAPTDLSTHVAQLHAIRWQAASQHWVPRTRIDLRRLNPRSGLQGLSVLDAHASRRSIHAPVLNASFSLASTISEELSRRIGGPGDISSDHLSEQLPPPGDSRHVG